MNKREEDKYKILDEENAILKEIIQTYDNILSELSENQVINLSSSTTSRLQDLEERWIRLSDSGDLG